MGDRINRELLQKQGHVFSYEWVSGNPCDAEYDYVHIKNCEQCKYDTIIDTFDNDIGSMIYQYTIGSWKYI